MKRPRVLVTTATAFRDRDLRRYDALTGLNYSQALARAGGLPWMVANLAPELAEAYVEGCDAVLFSGGADVDPARYGRPPHPRLGHVDGGRDAFELALYRAAREAGRPVLGVCRGIQLVNVAEGGTLHQHLPAVPRTQGHEQRDLDGPPYHRVGLEPGCRLARALGRDELRVNSFHHQAIAELAPGLRAVAWADDGVIEAVEGADGAFLLAVQWHPEMNAAEHPEAEAPFRLLVEAAAEARRAAARA